MVKSMHCKNGLVKLTNHWLPQFHLLFSYWMTVMVKSMHVCIPQVLAGYIHSSLAITKITIPCG